jgi:hypothetical protein
MQIHFVSALSSLDEDQIAPALLALAANVLEQFPIAYTIRIETTGSRVYQLSGTGEEGDSGDSEAGRTGGVEQDLPGNGGPEFLEDGRE